MTGEAIRRLPSLVTKAVIAVASEIVAFGSLGAYVVTGLNKRRSTSTTAVITT